MSFAIKTAGTKQYSSVPLRQMFQVRLSVELVQLYTTTSSKHVAWRPDWLTLSERFIVLLVVEFEAVKKGRKV